MLTKPVSGFTEFKLENTSKYILGYEDNIPFDWLKQAIHGLETGLPFCVIGETDPGTCICVVGWNCHIIWEKDKASVEAGEIVHEYSPVNMRDFCNMLYSDISENIEDWVNFYWCVSDDTLDARKNELNSLLIRLKELLNEK